MADILDFRGITTLDIAPQNVLDGATGLEEVLILGWKNEEFYMAGSTGNIGETLILLELAKQSLMESFG